MAEACDGVVLRVPVALSAQIKQIVARCCARDSATIDDSCWLVVDLYIDSLILTEIVYELEAAFNIGIADSEMNDIYQLADVYRLVASKLAAN